MPLIILTIIILIGIISILSINPISSEIYLTGKQIIWKVLIQYKKLI